jgi:hypothetical protein
MLVALRSYSWRNGLIVQRSRVDLGGLRHLVCEIVVIGITIQRVQNGEGKEG